MNVEYFHFLVQTQEPMSHICRKTGDTTVTILALFKCQHCDSHFCTVPGWMQAAGTHRCHKISIIHTLLKWTGTPQDRSSHKADVCSVAPCAAWANVSSSNDCELQKFTKFLRIVGISVPHTPSWLCEGKVPLRLCLTFTLLVVHQHWVTCLTVSVDVTTPPLHLEVCDCTSFPPAVAVYPSYCK
jgi:hypothetical protein